ncbi:hypothetical protein GCM10009117_02010 [Gangjinia marincola]|uniref:Uncharacterized protein n=1 Tax=Gangjinia marincola TaxID=578463 RepID=A0ABP3XSY3_9FLAO
MKLHLAFVFLPFFIFSSCDQTQARQEVDACTAATLNQQATYNDLVQDIPLDVLTALVELPDEHRALGRNKAGYIHVRFQLHSTRLTDYAIRTRRNEALTEYLKTLQYAFSYQRTAGDFQFVPPNDLLQQYDDQPPSEADLASGTAFFAYSLGISLMSLSHSDWYSHAESTLIIRNEINALHPNIQLMLNYLKTSVSVLNEVDAQAPNRLLFNAIAFYSLGNYLNDQEAKEIGITFANAALDQHDEVSGYFIEGGGWDSSYNGVAIKLGLELFTIIPAGEDQELKNRLQDIASCAAQWQSSRILPTGEITTEGNTRVYPGGEEFLGNEKQVDVIKSIKAFFYMAMLSNENEYRALAEQVIGYYQK